MKHDKWTHQAQLALVSSSANSAWATSRSLHARFVAASGSSAVRQPGRCPPAAAGPAEHPADVLISSALVRRPALISHAGDSDAGLRSASLMAVNPASGS
jgi:hypothetical protein